MSQCQRPVCRTLQRERPWPVRLEATLDTARERGATTISSPEGELPLPATVENLEGLKEELFERHNRRLPGRQRSGGYGVDEEIVLVEIDSLQPARFGRLAVIKQSPFSVGLFWPCESDISVWPFED